jgi:glycine betaine/choline ABC-type transport system substrate-binding protein
MEIFEKLWGWNVPFYKDYSIELCEIRVKSGGYSSKHYHEYKENTFKITKGKLAVFVFNEDGSKQLLTYYLDPDSPAVTLSPKVVHQFFALEETTAIELYRSSTDSKIDPQDIIRLSEGGLFFSL